VGQHFASLGVFIAETAFAWFCPPGRVEKLFSITGREHLDAALAQGKGGILYGAHFTTLELCGRQVKSLVPFFAFMYRSRSSDLLNEIQRRGRRRTAHTSFSRNNVRAMMRSLRSNAVVWYAADQVCLDKYGALVPFFGLPAMTNTATSRIARVSGAAVVPFAFRRRDDDSGYEIEFRPALAEFPSASAFDDTKRLMKHLEGFIRQAPDQYLWIHRRFSGRPHPLPNIYARRG
jgi:KDO2-lipid IV(A) lauroyltransferase